MRTSSGGLRWTSFRRLAVTVAAVVAVFAIAVLALIALGPRTDPNPTPDSPSVPPLPDALLERTWLASTERFAIAGTLRGDRVQLPVVERPLRASSGLVVSTNMPPGSPSDGSRLIVRNLVTREVWPEWDTETVIRWVANDSQRVVVAGLSVVPGGDRLQIPAVQQLLADGSRALLIESRGAPESWQSMQLSRPLVLSVSGRTLVAAACRWDGFTLGSQMCDVEAVDLPGGRRRDILEDVSAIPVMATDTVVLGATDGSVSAFSLLTGDSPWTIPTSGAPAMYLSADGAHVYLARPDPSSGGFELQRVDVATGESETVWQWSDREGYLWDSLSWDTYATIGPTPAIADAIAAGTAKAVVVDTSQPSNRWEVRLR